jgi:hypothetical protein
VRKVPIAPIGEKWLSPVRSRREQLEPRCQRRVAAMRPHRPSLVQRLALGPGQLAASPVTLRSPWDCRSCSAMTSFKANVAARLTYIVLFAGVGTAGGIAAGWLLPLLACVVHGGLEGLSALDSGHYRPRSLAGQVRPAIETAT